VAKKKFTIFPKLGNLSRKKENIATYSFFHFGKILHLKNSIPNVTGLISSPVSNIKVTKVLGYIMCFWVSWGGGGGGGGWVGGGFIRWYWNKSTQVLELASLLQVSKSIIFVRFVLLLKLNAMWTRFQLFCVLRERGKGVIIPVGWM
jgi:hypothetical protein